MRIVKFMVLAVLLLSTRVAEAKDHDGYDLLSFVSVSSMTASQIKVTSLLGKPAKIEEGKKRTWWYYSKGKTNLVISWNKKSLLPEKFSFTSTFDGKGNFDKTLSAKLQSGTTDLSQAVKILGMPKDLTIKSNKQEMHYAYENKMLRLFFRDRKLVDYCLY